MAAKGSFPLKPHLVLVSSAKKIHFCSCVISDSRDSLMLSLQTCPTGGSVADLGKTRSAQEDREPRLTCQSQVCLWNTFACIKQSEYTSNGKTDTWNTAGEERSHKYLFSAAPCTEQPVTTTSRKNRRPQACYFWSGILHLFQQD